MRCALVGLVLLAVCPSPQAQTNQSPSAAKAAQGDPEATAVRARLQAFGYDNVTDLDRDRAGIWHARALKDNEVISVIVDKGGRIIPRRR